MDAAAGGLAGAAASPGQPERAEVAQAAGVDAAAGGQAGGNSGARATRRARNCGTQRAGRLERGAREREPPENFGAPQLNIICIISWRVAPEIISASCYV